MDRPKKAILGVITLLMLVIFISGCTMNEKLIYNDTFNITRFPETPESAVYDDMNVTLPNGTKTVRIEYDISGGKPTSNMMAVLFDRKPDDYPTYIGLMMVAWNNNNTMFFKVNTDIKILQLKEVRDFNGTAKDSLKFENTTGNFLVIRGTDIKGKIKVYVTT